ncbi:MAG: D-alanyl-D-alanine carboxypeptidase family protein [Dehalococcoidia bacterium]
MKKYLRPKYLILFVVGLVALLIGGSYVQLNRDIPDLALKETTDAAVPAEAQGGDEASLALPLPAKGSAAVAIAGVGQMGAVRDERSQPIASLAKVMTAYVILKDHPLTPGEKGPDIQVQASDVELYRAQERNGESVIAVKEGQTFTQAELMQGLLIPSGNNFAFMLAAWNSGSDEAFVERMNQEAAALGMTKTHYAEPSGVSAETRSTAPDQARLAEAAMANPVIADIVVKKQAILPNVGVLFNVNSELERMSLAGIKTGWTEDAGGCFMFAADRVVDGAPVRIYGAVLGQDTLADAFNSSNALIATASASLQRLAVVTKDEQLAVVRTKWDENAAAVAASDASLVVWPGLKVARTVEAGPALESVKQGQEVGKVIYSAGGQVIPVPLLASESVSGAGIGWRLTRLQ